MTPICAVAMNRPRTMKFSGKGRRFRRRCPSVLAVGIRGATPSRVAAGAPQRHFVATGSAGGQLEITASCELQWKRLLLSGQGADLDQHRARVYKKSGRPSQPPARHGGIFHWARAITQKHTHPPQRNRGVIDVGKQTLPVWAHHQRRPSIQSGGGRPVARKRFAWRFSRVHWAPGDHAAGEGIVEMVFCEIVVVFGITGI